jgi:type I restriction enzyme M protein
MTRPNTVTLFLRRKPTQPDTAEHYRERVEEWFKGCAANKRKQVIYKDEPLLERYCTHINVPLADYQSLLRGEADGGWKQQEHFQTYHEVFQKSTELKALKKTRNFKALNKDEQTAEIFKRCLAYVQTIEREKLYYFCLASDQTNPVLIIRSPSGTKEIKKFLGYNWSGSKGDEGIKLIEDTSGKHITDLYDGPDPNNPTQFNRTNSAKLSSHVAANFSGALGTIPEELREVTNSARLVDTLDFKRDIFDKQISLIPKGSLFPKSSHYRSENLANLASLLRRGKATKYGESSIQVIKSGQARGHFEFDFTEKYYAQPSFTLDERQLKPGDILINSTGKGTAGRVTYFDIPGTFVVDSHITIFRTNKKLLPKFGLYSLERIGFTTLESLAHGASGQIELSLDTIGQVEIPLPPTNIQNEIVSECERIDAAVLEASNKIAKSQIAINIEVESIYTSQTPRIEIAKLLSDKPQYGLNEKLNEAGIGYKTFRMNEIVKGRMVDNGSMKCADISAEEFGKYRLNKGDLLFNRTNSIEHVGKTGLFDLDGDYCFASYLIRVVPDIQKVLPLFLLKMMNSPAFQAEAKGKASKSINQSNINATVMKNIKVPIPFSDKQQEFVAKVEALEKQIADAQAVIDAAPARKEAVMKKYL